MKAIEEIHAEAEKFVKEKFGIMRSNEERITILAIMKMRVELLMLEAKFNDVEWVQADTVLAEDIVPRKKK